MDTAMKVMPIKVAIMKYFFLISLIAVTGCAVYEPNPLVPEDVWTALEAVDLQNTTTSSELQRGERTFDYSNGLSVDEAASVAVLLNPALRVFRSDLDVQEAQLVQARLLPNPSLELRGLSAVDGLSGATEITAVFDFTEALLQRSGRKNVARLGLKKVHWEVAKSEWQTASEVRRKYIEVRYLEEALQLNRKLFGITEGIYGNIETRRQRGAASTLDSIIAETDLFDLEGEHKRLSGDYEAARKEFSALLGLPVSYPVRLESSQTPFAYKSPSLALDNELAILMRCNPTLRTLEQEYLITEAELKLAHTMQFPRIEFGPSFEGGRGDSEIGFALGMSIPLFNRGQGQIAIHGAQREKQFLTYVSELHSIRSQFLTSRQRLQKIEEELDYHFATVVPHLNRIVKLSKTAYQQGELELIPFLIQQNRMLSARRDLLSRLRDFHLEKLNVFWTRGPDCLINTNPH